MAPASSEGPAGPPAATEELGAAPLSPEVHVGPTDDAGGAPTRGRRRALACAVLLSCAVAVAIVLLESRSTGSRQAAGGAPPGETTTSVTRRTLSETSTVDGTLGYGSTLELYDRLAGTFTWLPAVGSVITRGGALWRVNNLPVVLMYGSVPAYRTLRRGISDGPDVAELNRNLIDLGFDPYGEISDDEEFSEATAAAVRRWQKADGLTETGIVTLGRVIFAPGPRRVTVVHVTLGQDPPGSEGAGSEPESPQAAARKEPAAKHPAAKHPASKHPAANNPGAKEEPAKDASAKEEATAKEEGAAKEEAAAKEAAAKKSNPQDSEESAGGEGTLALSTTSTQQTVLVELKAELQQLAHVGERAPVTLPGGRTVQGRIIDVGTVATESKEDEHGGGEGGGGAATISVTLTLAHRVARLDQAPVSVELVKSIRHHVLTVPATALSAVAGGGYAVQALIGAHRVELPVVPGMFADGYVQVEGPGIHEGLTVTQSQ
jgi:peptidoglycan hydrolase-like protein with peptidoglycan-binding domain